MSVTKEDALAYLPCSGIAAYRKGEMIYDRHHPSRAIYLVIDGKVKISRPAGNHHVIVGIYQPDDFFGESAFVYLPNRAEEATALENTKVMTWDVSEIEEQILKQPRLGVALMQVAVERIAERMRRITSFSFDNIPRRLARTLIELSERLGQPQPDGCVHLPPLSHELLAQYVGTSREIVTHWMAQLRRNGCVTYSRKAVVLYRDKLTAWSAALAAQPAPTQESAEAEPPSGE